MPAAEVGRRLSWFDLAAGFKKETAMCADFKSRFAFSGLHRSAGSLVDGSDGTRTRDLRRDRPAF